MSVIRFAAAAGMMLAAVACGDAVEPGSPLEGEWAATVFLIRPAGLDSIDVLSLGGSLDIAVAQSGRTSGALVAPSGLTGGGPLTVDMTGDARIEGSTVRFDQVQDTFVRYLEWSLAGDTLLVDDQPATTTNFTVRLVRRR